MILLSPSSIRIRLHLGIGQWLAIMALTLLAGFAPVTAAAPATEIDPVVIASSEPAILTCPSTFPAEPPAGKTARHNEATRLSPLGEACRERADYFAYYGTLLLTLKRPQEAAIALEKALMLAPDLGGAQLDYAQALAELGELGPARQLASDVAARPDLPPRLQAWLLDQLDAWRGDGWRLAWSIDWMAGGESNLNSSPDLRFLTLTLPGGNVPLELDASEGRIAGNAQRSDIALAAAHPLGSGMLQIGTEYLLRSSPGRSSTRQNLGGASLTYLHPLWAGQWGARLERTRINIGDETAYTGTGWSLRYQLPATLTPENCLLSFGRAGERREFPGAAYQNGRYEGSLAQFVCQAADWRLTLGLQDGQDHALDPIRLGGDQQRTDASFSIARSFGSHLLTMAVSNSRASDRQVYSTLLGGENRRIERLTTRFSWEHPLDPHWSLIGYLERAVQNSNIDLFGMRNNALYFGIRVHGR